MAPTLTRPAMVYMVLLYRKGLRIKGNRSFMFVVQNMCDTLPWVNCARRHDGHQFGDGQRLCLNQTGSLANSNAKLVDERRGVDLGQEA